MQLEQARELQPEVFAAYGELMAAVWEQSELEPELLELARLRMATLTRCQVDAARRYRTAGWGGIAEKRVARLPSWPTDPSFSGRERRALRYAEEFALDPASVTDECWAGLDAEFGADETVQLTMSLAVLVEFQRFCLAAGLDDVSIPWSPTVEAIAIPTPS